MKIGFDASRAFVDEPTGTENYSLKLLESMLEVGREFQFVVFTKDKPTFKGSTLQGGARFVRIGWPKLWTQGGLALRTWLDQIDVLFIPAHTLPVLRKPGLKTVVTIHGLEYEYLPQYYRFPQRIYLTWSTRYAASKATRLIAVSEFTKNQMVEELGVDAEKVKVVHEGVDTKVYSKSYKDNLKDSVLLELGIQKPYILFVGVVQPRKNLERLIQAFSRISENRKFKNLELVVAGKLGWMYDKILNAPKKHGVGSKVKFLGYIKQEWMPILMQEALIYVQPSLTEGFGLPVLESMAAGTPVVAADAGALPEVVGEAGLLFDPKSVDDMVLKLTKMLTDPGMRKRYSERGRSWSRGFSWKRAAIDTLSVLAEASS